MIRIGIIEDNDYTLERLKTQFKTSPNFECVLAVNSVEKFLSFYASYMEIDIILLDINLPGMSGIEGIPKLRNLNADWEIIMFTVYQDADKIFQAICAGANGYLLKDLNQVELKEQLLKIKEKGGALLSPQIARRVLDYFQPTRKKEKQEQKEKPQFNEKELQTIRFFVDGLTYNEVAEKIGISTNGVRYHVKNIYKKLQVQTKSQMIKKYWDGEVE